MKCLKCGKEQVPPLLSIVEDGKTYGIVMCDDCAEKTLKEQEF